MKIYEKLEKIQAEFKTPKNRFNDHGNFNYRSLEPMLVELKPILVRHKCILIFNDRLEDCAGTPHIVVTATLVNLESTDEIIQATSLAQEAAIQKGMQAAQISGSTSSYARKYALSALLLVDESEEIDMKQGDQSDWDTEISKSKTPQELMAVFQRMDAIAKRDFTPMLSERKKELSDAK